MRALVPVPTVKSLDSGDADAHNSSPAPYSTHIASQACVVRKKSTARKSPVSSLKEPVIPGDGFEVGFANENFHKRIEDVVHNTEIPQAILNASTTKRSKRSYSDSFDVLRAETLATVVAGVSDHKRRKTVFAGSDARGRQNDALADSPTPPPSSFVFSASRKQESDRAAPACDRAVVQTPEDELASETYKVKPIVASIISDVLVDVFDAGRLDGFWSRQATQRNEGDVDLQSHDGYVYFETYPKMATTSVEAGDTIVIEEDKVAPVKTTTKKSVTWASGDKLVDVRYINTRLQLIQSWNPACLDTLPFTPRALRVFQMRRDFENDTESDLYIDDDLAGDGSGEVRNEEEPWHGSLCGRSSDVDASQRAYWHLQNRGGSFSPTFARVRPTVSAVPAERRVKANTTNCPRGRDGYRTLSPHGQHVDEHSLPSPAHTYFSVYGDFRARNEDVARTSPADAASRASGNSCNIS